jgi:hypothetical protein
VNYEMEKELKKEVVTQFKVLSQHLPGGDWRKPWKAIRIANLRTSIWTWYLLNIKHEC